MRKNFDIIPGEYYRKTIKDEFFEAGELIIVTSISVENVHIRQGEHGYTYGIDEFLENFEPEPDGLDIRQKEISDLLKESNNIQFKTLQFQNSVSAPVLQSSNDSTDLALNTKSATEMTQRIESINTQVEKIKYQIKSNTDKLEALLEEQKSALEARQRDLLALAGRANEALWTINLYLGKGEQIVRLKKGKPAPENEKICIRQLVLYADEECAVMTEKGGIDASKLDEFDRWVSEPKNINVLLPETKGVVAIKPRRNSKDYGKDIDPWSAAMKNEANKKTYFLIRNGENLYRLSAEIEVDKNLVPLKDEYLSLFKGEREYNFKTHSYEYGEPPKPGTDAYMEAMNAADSKQMHYFRILLVLQGLIDRTEIFHPLPNNRINIIAQAYHEEYVRYVYDGEMLLGNDKLSFMEWLKEINSQLDVGMRVMGQWNSTQGISHDERSERLGYKHASLPNYDELYTLESESSDNKYYTFYYNREEHIYRRNWDDSPAKRRVSCKIYRSDLFILNFDLAKIEDMKYYLQNRTDRHDYLYLVPLLKKALELKEKEAKTEAPFRQLLISEISKAYKSESMPTIEDSIDTLIDWWKFKNKTHRALVKTDDAKALRMIVQEYGLRLRREEERKVYLQYKEEILNAVKLLHPDLIYLGHKADNLFVVLVPSQDDKMVFVSEYTYSRDNRNGRLTLREEKHWQTIDKRRLRWLSLYESSQYEKWQFDVRKERYLTGDDEKYIINTITKDKEIFDDLTKNSYSRFDSRKNPVNKILCFNRLMNKTDSLRMYFWTYKADIPKKLINNHAQEPKMGFLTVSLEKDKNGNQVIRKATGWTCSGECSYSIEDEFSVWNNNHYHESQGKAQTIWKDDKAIFEFTEDSKKVDIFNEQKREIETQAYSFTRKFRDIIFKKEMDILKQDVINKYGNESMLEYRLKDLKQQNKAPTKPEFRHLDNVIEYMIEDKFAISSLSIEDIVKINEEKKYKAKEELLKDVEKLKNNGLMDMKIEELMKLDEETPVEALE